MARCILGIGIAERLHEDLFQRPVGRLQRPDDHPGIPGGLPDHAQPRGPGRFDQDRPGITSLAIVVVGQPGWQAAGVEKACEVGERAVTCEGNARRIFNL